MKSISDISTALIQNKKDYIDKALNKALSTYGFVEFYKEVPDFLSAIKNFYDLRITNAIAKDDWPGIKEAVHFAIENGALDVWYDHQGLNQYVEIQGYTCYTCCLKEKSLMEVEQPCRTGFQAQELMDRLCGLRDFSKYIGGGYARL